MPQLAPTLIFSQVFWVITCFVLMYIMMRYFILPPITAIMDAREEGIQNDIITAENLKKELENAINAYETSLEEANYKAGEILKQTNNEIQDFVKSEEQKFSSRMNELTEDARSKIEESKVKVLGEVEDLAIGLVGQVMQKLVNENISIDTAKSYITKEMKGA